MAQRVVIVGSGSGGTMVANRLVRAIPEDVRSGKVEVVLIGAESTHVYQPGFLYIALGQAQPEGFKRPETDMLLPGVQWVPEAATKIDPTKKSVQVASGRTIEYDFLVLATGSVPDLDAIPGFREGGHSFYTLEESLRLRDALQSFDHGKLLLIIGVPHKCPVAPLEFLFMYDDWLRRTGKRDQIELEYTYPISRLHSLQPVSDWIDQLFPERNIKFQTFFNVETVDPVKKVVYTLEGEEDNYDLLVGIPPHVGAQVIRDSKLGDRDGWIPTDRLTLKVKGYDNMYAIGDATDLPLSKAGSTTHYESEVVVKNLVHELQGEKPVVLYDGKIYCFIEAGLDQATHISFDYNHPPEPSNPTATVHWFKLAFNEMYWLSLRGLF
ncbi:NAD(P)/FAD-dependent oxidoreductase [Alicyclobacillaceae bacterium I2511]|nr:NAD(P)/FAD-dependent oxidoreductase [Alicyclobacillaceae bacterium I2511]